MERINLIPFPYYDNGQLGKTVDGITAELQPDNSVRFYGTATDKYSFYFQYINKHIQIYRKTVYLSGCPGGGSDKTYYMNFMLNDGSANHYWDDIGSGTIAEGQADIGYSGFVVNSGVTLDVIVKPMASFINTTYTPYIPDLSKVKVSRCGENVFNGKMEKGKINTANGELIESNGNYRTADFIPVMPNTEYSITANRSGGYVWIIGYTSEQKGIADGAYAIVDPAAIINLGNAISVTFTTTPTTKYLKFYLTVGDNIKSACIKKGNNLNFVDYEGADFPVTADGIVSGMTSLSPNMTILSDTPGVIINAEYNRDVEKYVGSLEDRIATLETALAKI